MVALPVRWVTVLVESVGLILCVRMWVIPILIDIDMLVLVVKVRWVKDTNILQAVNYLQVHSNDQNGVCLYSFNSTDV